MHNVAMTQHAAKATSLVRSAAVVAVVAARVGQAAPPIFVGAFVDAMMPAPLEQREDKKKKMHEH